MGGQGDTERQAEKDQRGELNEPSPAPRKRRKDIGDQGYQKQDDLIGPVQCAMPVIKSMNVRLLYNMNAMRVIKSAVFSLGKESRHNYGIVSMILLVAGMMWLCGSAHAAKLYKWVDENGMVHFSDSIPPQAIKKQHSEIDQRGFETRNVEAAKTPAKIEEMKRQQALNAEQDRLAKERAEQDRILLDTFSSEDEIIAARDRQIATIEASNQLALSSIDSLTHKLQDQTSRAADYERQGQEVPQEVLDEIDKIKRLIEMRRASIRTRKQEQHTLKEKYQAYVDRFRELKNSNRNL